jgi:RNA polymerase sigma-70 factor (ECF subfamily)
MSAWGDAVTQTRVAADGFAAFFGSTVSGMLARALLLCGHRPDAEDAVSEAYCEALARWDRVGGYDSPEGWVYRVMCQRLWKSARRQARQVPVGLEVPVPAHVGPERAAEVREVLGALAGLPPRQYLVMVLNLEGRSQAEIAAALRIRTGTVGAHLFRARRALEQMLGTAPEQRRAGEPLVAGTGRSTVLRRLPADPVAAAVRDAARWLEESVEADPAARAAVLARVGAAATGGRPWRRLRYRRRHGRRRHR